MDARAFTLSATLLALALASAPALAEVEANAMPSYLDTTLSAPVNGEIYVQTDSPGTYHVSITGVPEDWLSYQKTVRVEDGQSVSYAVSPRATGRYTLSMTVKGPGGTADAECRLWVAPAGPPAGGAGGRGGGSPEGTGGTATGGGLTGMFVLSPQNAAIAIYAITIITVIAVLLAGHFTLKKETAVQGSDFIKLTTK